VILGVHDWPWARVRRLRPRASRKARSRGCRRRSEIHVRRRRPVGLMYSGVPTSGRGGEPSPAPRRPRARCPKSVTMLPFVSRMFPVMRGGSTVGGAWSSPGDSATRRLTRHRQLLLPRKFLRGIRLDVGHHVGRGALACRSRAAADVGVGEPGAIPDFVVNRSGPSSDPSSGRST